MPEYNVHLFAVVRVKLPNVTADSQTDAIAKAESEVPLTEIFRDVDWNDTLDVEWADEVSHYLVDEVGDEQYEKSTFYCSDGETRMFDIEGTHEARCPVCMRLP